MLSRMKFEFDPLVAEMLGRIPTEVWVSSTSTFLDPAIGGGQFVRAIEQRLREYGHSDESISQRVFGFEQGQLNIPYAKQLARTKYKQALVGTYQVKSYDDILNWKTDMKFDVVIGNPPFQKVVGDSKISIGTVIIKRALELVAPGGILSMVSSSTFLGAGQKGLGYMFSENEVIEIFLNLNGYFPGVGIDIGGFILRKNEPTTSMIAVSNKQDKMILDTQQYKYETHKRYIPRSVTTDTLPILNKILQKSNEVFDFRASSIQGGTNLVGFWAGANTGVHPRYIGITFTGAFDKMATGHACRLEQAFPEKNIRAIFQGKLFHFIISLINGAQSSARPASLSFFPKVDLSTFQSFDDQCKYFGLTDAEKQIVQNWADSKKTTEWGD